jgi:hypothetical protein
MKLIVYVFANATLPTSRCLYAVICTMLHQQFALIVLVHAPTIFSHSLYCAGLLASSFARGLRGSFLYSSAARREVSMMFHLARGPSKQQRGHAVKDYAVGGSGASFTYSPSSLWRRR